MATAGRVATAFAAGEPISVELLLCTKGDTRMWGQISFTPVLSETDGTVENHVCFRSLLPVFLTGLRSRIPTSAQIFTCTWWNGTVLHALQRFADTQPLLQVGVITDITARKSTAEAMHLCDKALAATSEATLITDCCQPDNPIIYCNSGFTKLLGAPH